MADDPQSGAFSREAVANTIRVRDAVRDISKNMKTAFVDYGDSGKQFVGDLVPLFKQVNTGVTKYGENMERLKKSHKDVNKTIQDENKLRVTSNELAVRLDKNEKKRKENVREITALEKKRNVDLEKSQQRQISAEQKLSTIREEDYKTNEGFVRARQRYSKIVADEKKQQILINREARQKIQSAQDENTELELKNKYLV